MSKSLIAIPIAVLVMATTSWAAEPSPDYGRPGWYAGLGVGTGIAFLENAIQGELGGKVELNARAAVAVLGLVLVTASAQTRQAC